MMPDTMLMITTASKDVLRKFMLDVLLKRRSIVLRLGPRAGRIYATMHLPESLGVRASIGASLQRVHGHFFFLLWQHHA